MRAFLVANIPLRFFFALSNCIFSKPIAAPAASCGSSKQAFMVNGALNVLLTLVMVVVGFTLWMLGVEAAEEEEEEEVEEEEERLDETANNAQPKRKKQKIILNRRVTPQKRDFQQDWKKGREWLQYSEHQGMWCSICYAFCQHPGVIGCKSKQNALAVPTKQFRYRNVSKHPDTNYHLLALGLSKNPRRESYTPGHK